MRQIAERVGKSAAWVNKARMKTARLSRPAIEHLGRSYQEDHRRQFTGQLSTLKMIAMRTSITLPIRSSTYWGPA